MFEPPNIAGQIKHQWASDPSLWGVAELITPLWGRAYRVTGAKFVKKLPRLIHICQEEICLHMQSQFTPLRGRQATVRNLSKMCLDCSKFAYKKFACASKQILAKAKAEPAPAESLCGGK